MVRPLTEPSTPLRSVVLAGNDYANYSAPTHTWINTVPLLPQALPEILGQMSLRRTSSTRQPKSPHRPSNSLPGLRETPQATHPLPSRRHTPTRKISDHLTIRRRRRSSAGVTYDTAFPGNVNKDFLRLFSRTLVKEKKLLGEEPDEQVYRALDKQHVIASSPAPVGDFDLSLPLPPSDDDRDFCEETPSPIQPRENIPSLNTAHVPAKPVFKSYLEQILESRRNKPLRELALQFDRESSEEPAHPDKLKGIFNTSKFIIENTLSGLPEALNDDKEEVSYLKLAEPVAFGLLRGDESSNESSDKESASAIHEARSRSVRLPQIGLGNKTPESYDIKFDNIDQLDVPSWEPVPIYNDPDALELGLDGVNINEEIGSDPQMYDFDPGGESAEGKFASPNSEISHSEIIQGHLTVANDDIISDLTLQLDAPSPVTQAPVLPSPPDRLCEPQASALEPPILKTFDLPRNFVKGLVAIAQHLPASVRVGSPPRKKRKIRRVNTDILAILQKKSNEFLLQAMQDVSDYAGHRNSDQIDISDALLFVSRINSRHKMLGEKIELPKLAHSVFPLETLTSLDNSLQESVKIKARKRPTSPEKLVSANSSYIERKSM